MTGGSSKTKTTIGDLEENMVFDTPTYTLRNPNGMTSNMVATSLPVAAFDFLFENHGKLPHSKNGYIFRQTNELKDKYGNSQETFVEILWFSNETIEKINYTDRYAFNNEGIFKLADASYLHPAFKDTDIYNYQGYDRGQVPKAFSGFVGGTHADDHMLGNFPK